MDDDINNDVRTSAHGEARELQPVRGRPFARGVSGNPRGRPFGARNRSTLLAQAHFDEVAKAISEKAIAMALDGDPMALKLCVERILPRRRDTAVVIDDMPEVASASECTSAIGAVIRSA